MKHQYFSFSIGIILLVIGCISIIVSLIILPNDYSSRIMSLTYKLSGFALMFFSGILFVASRDTRYRELKIRSTENFQIAKDAHNMINEIGSQNNIEMVRENVSYYKSIHPNSPIK